MQTTKPDQKQSRPQEHNQSMSERDKQKTVSNPSPGSADPGNEGSAGAQQGTGTRRH